MHKLIITYCLNCTSDSMSEIEDFSETGFSLILHNNLILNPAIFFGNVLTCIFIQIQDIIHMLIQIIKEFSVSHACMLYCFCKSADYLPLRKSFPCRDIYIYLLRLIKKTDKISCKWRINSSFSADRCICSCKKCCSIINERNTSSIGSCYKSG